MTRPRVEGEAGYLFGGEWLTFGPGNPCDSWEDQAFRWNGEAAAQRAAVARLTAEVERLRGIAQQAIWMLNEWDESMSSYQQGTSDGATAKELAARLAALSLPTPAPEAQR